jgi:hypothetical protein
VGAIEDILEWSTSKLSPWRQDALRRLASGAAIGAQDHDDLLSLIKESTGFSISPKPAAPIALAKAHLSAVTAGASLQIKTIRNVTNVNRLMQSAALTFAEGLTIIYGRNGSGKSGFVRIFRTACRTRSDNPAKLKVLADVYGSSTGPQEAEIVIETAAGEVIVPWKAGGPASEALLQVAVFDSSAAELYVDGGNQIQFLPFGLALPHKLNALCITLKSKLDAERKPTTDQIALVMVAFESQRVTKAQTFYSGLSAITTDAQIDEIAKFSKDDQIRLDELMRLLTAATASAADLTALSTWVQGLGKECDSLAHALSDAKLREYHILKQQAVEARKAAGLDAGLLFSAEPLPGVGGETWRRLWLAARDYSIADAYFTREFPVLNSGDVQENCLLCHQPLSPAASERLERFQAICWWCTRNHSGSNRGKGCRGDHHPTQARDIYIEGLADPFGTDSQARWRIGSSDHRLPKQRSGTTCCRRYDFAGDRNHATSPFAVDFPRGIIDGTVEASISGSDGVGER